MTRSTVYSSWIIVMFNLNENNLSHSMQYGAWDHDSMNISNGCITTESWHITCALLSTTAI
jgi:hypothetical protein